MPNPEFIDVIAAAIAASIATVLGGDADTARDGGPAEQQRLCRCAAYQLWFDLDSTQLFDLAHAKLAAEQQRRTDMRLRVVA
jgi:hypothetical protein